MNEKLKRRLFVRFKKLETSYHVLNYLFWECTTRCNLNCLHCGSDCSKDSANADMPMADFLSALDTIKYKEDLITVVLTGGEPLLRKDLESCGREIRKRGMRWSMVSNGYLYTPEKHNLLLNAGMGALTFSLDGLEETHNWLRNSSTSFARVDKAIDLVVGTPRLNFDIVTCVNKRNISELAVIYSYLIEKKVQAWRLFTITPIGRAAENTELSLTDKQFKELMDFIAAKRNLNELDIKFSCEGYVGSYESKVRDTPFFCRAGINIGSVLIDGSIAACPNIDRSFTQGNIYKDNFFDIWQTGFRNFRNRDWTKKGQCADCKEYTCCLGNGLHNWHGNKENVLVCHYNKILSAG